jgi:hypothetical protein
MTGLAAVDLKSSKAFGGGNWRKKQNGNTDKLVEQLSNANSEIAGWWQRGKMGCKRSGTSSIAADSTAGAPGAGAAPAAEEKQPLCDPHEMAPIKLP